MFKVFNSRVNRATEDRAREETAIVGGLSVSTVRSCLSIADRLLSLAAEQPFVGPFAKLLQEGIKICDTMLVNEENAKKFQLTLGDAAAITEEAIETATSDSSPVKMDIVKKFVEDLIFILRDAIRTLESFTKKGCLKKLLAGSSPSEIFQEYDNKLIKKFNDLNLALNIIQQKLLEVTYAKVEGIEQWCHDNGGLQTLLEDQTKLATLASKLGKLQALRVIRHAH